MVSGGKKGTSSFKVPYFLSILYYYYLLFVAEHSISLKENCFPEFGKRKKKRTMKSAKERRETEKKYLYVFYIDRNLYISKTNDSITSSSSFHYLILLFVILFVYAMKRTDQYRTEQRAGQVNA